MNTLKSIHIIAILFGTFYLGISAMNEAANIGSIQFNPESADEIKITSLDYISTDGNCVQYQAQYSDDQNEVIEVCR